MSDTPLPVIRVRPSEMSPHVIVVGDPERAKKVSDYLENPRQLAAWREYHSYRGEYKGLPVVATSHGVGAAGAAVAFEELIRAGAKTIIRVGTCGSYISNLRAGALLLPYAATREDGLTDELVRPELPAVADLDVMYTLREHARQHDTPFATGIIRTHAAFYHGMTPNPHQYWMDAGVIGIEMEYAALLVIATLRKVRAGGIFVIDGNPAEAQDMTDYNPHKQVVEDAKGQAIEIALETLLTLTQAQGD
jgi:uridine phosphorylase